jgi:methylmalonyl-CoA carboxyltransferase 12S subunit
MEELALGPALLILPLSILAGYLAGKFSSRESVRREIDEIKAMVAGQQARSAPEPAPATPPAAAAAVPPPAPVVMEAAAAPADEVSPEILMVLSAAVAAFLGKKARIRGARMLRPIDANAWAQQGRVFVQASHNLPHRAR